MVGVIIQTIEQLSEWECLVCQGRGKDADVDIYLRALIAYSWNKKEEDQFYTLNSKAREM